jgi:hypothetical protein
MKIIRLNLQEKSFQSVCITITTSAATFQCGSEEVKTQFWHHISQYHFQRRGLLEQLGPTWTRSFLPYQRNQGLNSDIKHKSELYLGINRASWSPNGANLWDSKSLSKVQEQFSSCSQIPILQMICIVWWTIPLEHGMQDGRDPWET